jgi:hypothetical protein
MAILGLLDKRPPEPRAARAEMFEWAGIDVGHLPRFVPGLVLAAGSGSAGAAQAFCELPSVMAEARAYRRRQVLNGSTPSQSAFEGAEEAYGERTPKRARGNPAVSGALQ